MATMSMIATPIAATTSQSRSESFIVFLQTPGVRRGRANDRQLRQSRNYRTTTAHGRLEAPPPAPNCHDEAKLVAGTSEFYLHAYPGGTHRTPVGGWARFMLS